MTKRLLSILFLLWICCVARGANPAFTDFDPTQFNANASGPQPKISLLVGGVVTNYVIENITNTILVSSNGYFTNIFTTNITVETINNVTNITQQQFVTNQFVTYQVVSNAFFTNVTILNGNGPWIPILNGFGTNTTIDELTVLDDFFVIGPGSPVFELVNGTTQILEAGYDTTNHGGWWGSISPTNVDYVPGANMTFTTNGHQVTVAASSVITNASITGYITNYGGLGTNTTFWLTSSGSVAGNWDNGSTAFLFNRSGGASTVQLGLRDGQLVFDYHPVGPGSVDVLYLSRDGNNVLANDNNSARIYDQSNNIVVTIKENSAGTETTTVAGTLETTGNITNDTLTASQFIASDANKAQTSTLNGNTLTNLHYQYTTNAIPNTGVLSFGGPAYFTNIQANLTLAAFAAVSSTAYETTVLFVTNSTGTDWTLTGPGGCAGPFGVFPGALVCTNKHMTRILFEHYGVQWTNMTKQDF